VPLLRWLGAWLLVLWLVAWVPPITVGKPWLCRASAARTGRRDLIGAWQRPH
jgi:hypothetical protein